MEDLYSSLPFTVNDNLRGHRTNHGLDKPILSCNLCKAKGFSRPDSLIRHRKSCLLKMAQNGVKPTRKVPQSKEGIYYRRSFNHLASALVVTGKTGGLPGRMITTLPVTSPQFTGESGLNSNLALLNNRSKTGLSTSDLFETTRTAGLRCPSILPATQIIQISRPLPSQGESSLVFESPLRDEFYSFGVTYFKQSYPLLHSPTFDPNRVHPFLREAIIMNGAYYIRNTPLLAKQVYSYVLNVLRSDLRGRIFREFMEFGDNNIQLQYELLLAFNLIQLLGWSHLEVTERRINDGYHSMNITMLRKSGMPATIIKLRKTLNPPHMTPCQDLWVKWVRYESMKRLIHLPFLLDCRRGDMSNLPPCIQDQELEDLGLFLPADGLLWSAATHNEWFHLVKASDAQSMLGMPIGVSVGTFLSGGQEPLPRFDTFSRFIIIKALIRAINVSFISVLYDQQRYRIKQALDTWTQCLQPLQKPDPSELGTFNWIGLFVYMLAVIIHSDTSRLVSQAEQNFDLFAGWLEEIPDTVSGDKRMKTICAPFRLSYN